MAYTKGAPKPPGSGRQKGTKNKKKVLRVAELLCERNINPIDELLNLIPSLEERDQAKIWLELQSYCEAKPKEADPVPDGNSEIEEQLEDVETEKLLKLVKKPDEGS